MPEFKRKPPKIPAGPRNARERIRRDEIWQAAGNESLVVNLF